MNEHPFGASVGAAGAKTRMTFERQKDGDFSVPTDVAIELSRREQIFEFASEMDPDQVRLDPATKALINASFERFAIP